MNTRTIKNPVTSKIQSIAQDSSKVTLLKLGFDNSGKVVYQETDEKGTLTIRGYLPDASQFISFK